MFEERKVIKESIMNNLRTPCIRIFVFGTLRTGGRLDYYMEGSSPQGLFYTRGQLMESSTGSAYINFEKNDAATIGEIHHVNYYCLQRINHLEYASGEFPKRYELVLIPVWPYNPDKDFVFSDENKTMAFCYKMREATAIRSGNWLKRRTAIDEIGQFLKEKTETTVYYNDVLKQMELFLKEY